MNTTSFTEFIVPKKVQQTTKERLDASDTLELFFHYLEDIEFLQHNSIVTTTILYQLYLGWLKEENPSTKPMAKKQFFIKSESKLLKRGWQYNITGDRLERKRLNRVPFKDLNFVQLEALTGIPIEKRLVNKGIYAQSSVLYNENQVFHKRDYTEFLSTIRRSGLNDLDRLTPGEKRALVSTCFDDQDLEIRGLLEDWTDLY